MYPWWGRPSVPRPCRCGRTEEDSCHEIGLSNHRNFPPFAHLPDFDGIDEDYYQQIEEGNMYTPSRHWVLVGEIISKQSDFIRPRALIETKYGERVLVNFHLEDSSTPALFNWRDIVPGRTLCIFYAKNKMFMDMNRGVRQEYSKTSMVFPASLEQLTKDCESLHHSLGEDSRRCFQCLKQPAGEKLKRCGQCKLCFYCSKQCQVEHWKYTHKRLCRYMNMLYRLVAMDFSNFEDFVYWDFGPTDQPSLAEYRERHRQAMHDFLRSHGAEPFSKQERLFKFLQYCREKVLDNDPIWQRIKDVVYPESSFIGSRAASSNLVSLLLSKNPLFQGLEELAKKYQGSSSQHHHVIDIQSDSAIDDVLNDAFMAVLFCSFPQWQVESKITGILWIVEQHYCIYQEGIFPSGTWRVHRPDHDGFLAQRIHCNDLAMFHDNLLLLSKMSLHFAEKFPDSLVVRVFRSAGGTSNIHYVREIATQETVDNIITLWIREDLPSCGSSFHPPNPDLPLVEQLMDFEMMSLVDRLMSIQRFRSSERTAEEASEDDE